MEGTEVTSESWVNTRSFKMISPTSDLLFQRLDNAARRGCVWKCARVCQWEGGIVFVQISPQERIWTSVSHDSSPARCESSIRHASTGLCVIPSPHTGSMRRQTGGRKKNKHLKQTSRLMTRFGEKKKKKSKSSSGSFFSLSRSQTGTCVSLDAARGLKWCSSLWKTAVGRAASAR